MTAAGDEAAGGSLPTDPGLCGACRHARHVTSDRGAAFLLCRLSREDDRFPRYPRLPVRSCAGFHPDGGGDGGAGGDGAASAGRDGSPGSAGGRGGGEGERA